MIYLFGMSHAINVIKAASAAPLSFTHENWASLLSTGTFFDLPTKPGAFAHDCIKVFIASPGVGWGFVADFQNTNTGQKQVASVDGYIQLLRSIEDQQDGNTFVSFVHGNEHSGLSLTQHAIAYDFFMPDSQETALTPGAQPVPFSAIKKQVEHAIRHTVACLAMARMLLPRMRLVHVLPPPPIASEAHIAKQPEGFSQAIQHHGITPIAVRMKYYTLMVQSLQEALSPFAVELIHPPAKCTLPNGALKEEFAYAATHANEAYGALVVQQIADIAAARD